MISSMAVMPLLALSFLPSLALVAFGQTATVGSYNAPAGGEWTSLTLNLRDQRYQSASTINFQNVGALGLRWSIITPSSVTAEPVVKNGRVYFADWNGNVYSVVLSTGKLLWNVSLGQTISSTPALADGLVYVAGGGHGNFASDGSVVFALSPRDGRVVWKTVVNPTMAIWASPIVYRGLLYVGVAGGGALSPCYEENSPACKGEMYALNALNGKVVWNFATSGTAGGAGIWGSVAIDPKLNALYFGTGNAYSGSGTVGYAYSIVSLNAATGKLNWFYQPYNSTAAGDDLDFGSTPNLFTVKVNGIFHSAVGLGSKDGRYYVLDRTNGALLEEPMIGVPGDRLGIFGLAGFMARTAGNPELFIPVHYNPSQSPLCHDNSTGVGTDGADCGAVRALFPKTGSIPWTFVSKGWVLGSVALVPGAVLFGDVEGNLYAISTSGTALYHYQLPSGVFSGVTVAEGSVVVPLAGNCRCADFGASGTSGVSMFSA